MSEITTFSNASSWEHSLVLKTDTELRKKKKNKAWLDILRSTCLPQACYVQKAPSRLCVTSPCIYQPYPALFSYFPVL